VKRIVTASAILAGVLLTAIGLAPSAQATVVTVSLPAAATISARTVFLSGTVQVGDDGTGLRSATLWFSYPGDAAPTQVGQAASRRTSLLKITARLDATRIKPGVNQVLVRDEADGTSQTVAVDLRRKSQLAITHAEFRPHAKMALAVRVLHYDPTRDTFVASRLSPVRLQESIGGTWSTLATVTSDAQGLAGAVIRAGRGAHYYRALRPDGATVMAAVSYTVRAGHGITATVLSPAVAIPT